MSHQPGTRFGPYDILVLLGVGGMGEVYQARDTRLNRLVALKFLPPDKVADPDRRRRFVNEAQAASALNHPGIITIFDISDADGADFIVMEFVRGQTLAEILAGRAFPVPEAIKYGAEIADALAAAHAAGIIHRDLKPANIMITEEGRAKVLDFGLAKLAEEPPAGSETAAMHTAIGAIVGTVAYMSPEQAQGRLLDARSDIFSFGLVLYEMLAGRRAFDGGNWMSNINAILRDEPRPLRDLRADVPEWLEQTINRCLRKNPAERFQRMSGLKQALTKGPLSPGASPMSKKDKPSIAVLPFENLSTDKENEYFGDGLAEEIINALTKIPELRVIARTSAFAFRGKEQDVRAIGERLRVGAVLEGSVRRSGNRIRVAAQLIQVGDESHLWSERFDREMNDIFEIQDEISQAIAHALKVKLTAPQDRTENVEVYQLYLKGMYNSYRRSAESLSRAQSLFEQALALDPGHAPSHAGLASIHWFRAQGSLARPMEVVPLSKLAAAKALALDPDNSQAYLVRGAISALFDYDWPAAEGDLSRAMELDGKSAVSRYSYAYCFLEPRGRHSESAEHFRRALETDPMSWLTHFGLSTSYYFRRDYDQAIKVARRALDIDENLWLIHCAIGGAQLHCGLLQDSVASLRRTLELAPFSSTAMGYLAAAYVRAGQAASADEVIDRARRMSSKSHVSQVCFAMYYAALRDDDEVFRLLNAAVDEREPFVVRVVADPIFDPYRESSRFRALMRRMNLLNG